MSFINRLESRFGRFAVPNLTVVLIAGQIALYVFVYLVPQGNQQGVLPQANVGLLMKFSLIASQVMAGEVWRLATFLFVPPITNLIFALFFWYLLYLMGTALELYWGTFRYNVYLLVGYLATVAVSFVIPDLPSTNGYLLASVFLAFAFLYPDFVLNLFFILPVKIKWLALLTWIGYFLVIAMGDWTARLVVSASICNFLLFFGGEILGRMKVGHRRMAFQTRQLGATGKRVHRCTVCGITNQTNPDLDFRYCSKCAGARCYCPEHLRNHEHITEPA